jgi:hypothetical protein
MFFRRGASHHDDPWLVEKLWLFTAGAVAAIAGMLLDNAWLIAIAALLLVAGVFIRFLPRGQSRPDGPDDSVPPA